MVVLVHGILWGCSQVLAWAAVIQGLDWARGFASKLAQSHGWVSECQISWGGGPVPLDVGGLHRAAQGPQGIPGKVILYTNTEDYNALFDLV